MHIFLFRKKKEKKRKTKETQEKPAPAKFILRNAIICHAHLCLFFHGSSFTSSRERGFLTHLKRYLIRRKCVEYQFGVWTYTENLAVAQKHFSRQQRKLFREKKR